MSVHAKYNKYMPDLLDALSIHFPLSMLSAWNNMLWFSREEDGYRLISEQVSHHPPVSAFHAESLKQEFEFHGTIYPKLKFWGKSVEAEPKGTMTLELLKWAYNAKQSTSSYTDGCLVTMNRCLAEHWVSCVSFFQA